MRFMNRHMPSWLTASSVFKLLAESGRLGSIFPRFRRKLEEAEAIVAEPQHMGRHEKSRCRVFEKGK
jgi:hypothetical protein